MSQMNLIGDSFFKMPSIPNINQTLLLIQTHKYFPINSAVSLDQNMPQPQEQPSCQDSQISLQQKLQANPSDIHTSTSIAKKKKGGCTCKKTKCLKMYCQCFREGKMCTDQCSCYGCSNDCDHQTQIAKARESINNKMGTGTKQKEDKGCHCKKSQCQKKYCQCYNAGVACSSSCKCQDCANGQCGQHHKERRRVVEEEESESRISGME